MTHTPGPWTFDEMVYSGELLIADPYTRPTAETNEGEMEANARLIAAAPDLLEACKELARFVDSVGSEHINRVPFAAARAAIAKAEGKNQ